MNVLIVGAGYFGGFLARELVEQGHRFLASHDIKNPINLKCGPAGGR